MRGPRWMQGLIVAFSTYSRLPMPRVEWNQDSMAYSICFFPLIGAPIGTLSVLWLVLSSRLGLGLILRACLLVLIPVLVTGGIHLDGLLDTADAVCSYKSREEKLEIMKDSRSGSFAVIWCCAYFLAAFAVASQILERMAAGGPPAAMQMASVWPYLIQLALIFLISRAYSGLALLRFPKAKKTGLVRTFADHAETKRTTYVLIGYLVLLTGLEVWLDPLRGTVCSLVAGCCFFLYHELAVKTFGGITGDLAGCFLCLTELALAAALAVCP